MNHFSAKWNDLGADSWTLKTVRTGYRIAFHSKPHLSSTPIFFPTYPEGSERFKVLQQAVEDMIEKSAIEEVDQSNPGQGFYSRIFVTPKATGGWRPVIDLSSLNLFIDCPSFKMETILSVLRALQQADWMTSIDLKDAYFHVPMHDSSKKFLRFGFQGRVWQFRALPFGLSTAPRIFTEMIRPLAAFLHKRGYHFHHYLDDWLMRHQEYQAVQIQTEQVIKLASELGWIVNLKKSDLEASQKSTYLGTIIDTVQMKAFPTERRLSNLGTLIRMFQTSEQRPSKSWQSLLGHLASLHQLVPGGRSRMRPLQRNLRRFFTQSAGKQVLVPILDESREALKWWSSELNTCAGLDISRAKRSILLFTDASKEGWGGSCPRPPGVRIVDSPGGRTPHKPPGDDGCPQCVPAPDHILRRPAGDGDVRQHVRCRVPQQSGGDKVSPVVRLDRGSSALLRSQEYNTVSTTPSGETERLGRLTQQKIHDTPDGMDHLARNLQVDKQTLGTIRSRPVRHKSKLPDPEVCVPTPGGSGLAYGRLLVSMDRDTGICLPPSDSVTSSSQQDPKRRSGPSLSRSSVAQPGLVRGSSRVIDRRTKKTSRVAKTTFTSHKRKESVPPQSPGIQPTRLEVIRGSLEDRGFSKRSAELISQPNKPSSTRLYQAKWIKFTSWSVQRKIDPVKATAPQLAEFFTELFDSGLSISTIKGYRSSISRVLRTAESSTAEAKELSDLMLAFEKQRPTVRREIPRWDLSLVLSALTRRPYEPLRESSLKDLTFKTCFLLSLATAKRVSEIQALSHIVNHNEDWSTITLTFDPNFVAKTQRHGDSTFPPVTVPSLEHTLSPDLEDVSLCPVRSVREYLRRTATIRVSSSKRLFISYQTGRGTDVTKNTISFWLKSLIKSAYSNSGRDDFTLHQIKPHELRALSTSLVFSKNLSVKEVMEAASWKGESTFARFYLRDVSHRYLDLKSLGPIVAAQSVVNL